MINRIRKPCDREFQFPFASLNICLVFRVPWDSIVSVECDPNDASLCWLKLFPVELHGCSMCDEDVMAYQPRLGTAVSNGTDCPVTGVSWSKVSRGVS